MDGIRKSRMILSRIGLFASAVALVLAFALPALADAWETGSKSCSPPNPIGWTKHKTKGTRAVIAPGSSVEVWTYGLPTGSWTTGSTAGEYGGGYWEVYASVGIDTDYTNGYCSNLS